MTRNDGDAWGAGETAAIDDAGPGQLAEAGDTATLPRWRGVRLPGSPQRRSRALPILVVLALLLGIAAGMVARGFISPAQVAANAHAPKASLITARVKFGVLSVTVTMRANVSDGNPVQIAAPSDLGGSLAVVTSVNVAAGQRVSDGKLLLTVAERPVFLFGGQIPVFRQMAPGMHGADVAELQAGLENAGYGIGSDASGHYGAGTAAAVAALYKASGVSPSYAGTPGAVANLTRQVRSDERALAAAKAKLAADKAAKDKPAVLAADRTAVQQAAVQLASARRALAAAVKTDGAQIPMGEVVFVPHLPVRVMSVAALGSTIGSSSNSGPGGRPPGSSSAAVQLGSGKVTLTAFAPVTQTRLLRPGMTGTATSDLSGAHFTVRVSSVSGPRLVLVPAGKVPGGVVGQNVRVTLTASRVRSFIVPVAAVSTAGSGQTYVTLSAGGGTTRTVPVRLGVSSGGLQAVTPVRSGALRPSDLVVLGIGSAK